MRPDEEAFTEWARSRQVGLLRIAVLVTGDRQRAEDLVQEALVAVATRWRRLADGSPDAYARQVIVRTNISWWRRRRREVVRDVADGALPGVVDPSGGVDRRLLLDQALATLTPSQRAVVVLRYYADLGERDTAAAMGVSIGTVKSQTHLALLRLRQRAPELVHLIGDPS